MIEIGLAAFLLLTLSTMSFGAEGPWGIDSKESYAMVTKSPSDTFIIDVRTRAEYEFVGHPDLPSGVPNIPYKFYPSWEFNIYFVEKVQERYKKEDTLIIICRSGVRAEAAAWLLLKAGFKSVFFMTDSFEGAKGPDGLRNVSGWKVNGLPYTYRLKDELLYR
jgi:rhodanese-related sulfurtransferase